MTFSNLSKKEKTLLGLTVCLALSFGVYNFIIQPLTARFEALNNEISANEIKLSKNLKILREKSGVTNEYARYAQMLKQNDSDEKEMAKLLSEIESVARKIAIRITDMKPRTVKPVDFYKRISVDVEVEAELKDIVKFIYNLQNEPYLLAVDRMRVESKARRNVTLLKGYLLVTRDLIP